MYGALVRGRHLEHTPNLPRKTAQAGNWDKELQPGGPMEIYPKIWQKFDAMGIELARRLRPDWSRTISRVSMEVDHRVEWQLLSAADRLWGDTLVNYELLDRESNGTSGNALKNNILVERKRLHAATGNPAWLTQRIVFTDLEVEPGNAGAMRWLPDEIQQGKHYHALVGQQKHR